MRLQGSSQRSQGVAGRYALTVDVPVPLRLQKRRYAYDFFILLVFSSVRESIASGSQVHETHRANWGRCVFLFLASAPLHTQDTEIGLGALVWQPQPSFSISDRSCLMAEKSRQNASRIARQKMKTRCERHGERESERRREDRATKLGRTRKTIRCYQSE